MYIAVLRAQISLWGRGQKKYWNHRQWVTTRKVSSGHSGMPTYLNSATVKAYTRPVQA